MNHEQGHCMNQTDEKQLIDSVLRKDRSAFEKLVRQYEGLVLHIVSPMIKDRGTREDISQDVFIRVFEKLHTFQYRSKLSTWIGQIAFNTSINYLKKRKDILLLDNTDMINTEVSNPNGSMAHPVDKSSPETIFIGNESRRQLEAVINKLPTVQKTILLLFHQDEQSLEEISLICDMPVNTVKSHLFRARRNLKEILVPSKEYRHE